MQRTTVITQEVMAMSGRPSHELQAFERLEQVALEKWDRKGKKPMRLLPESGKAVISAGGEL